MILSVYHFSMKIWVRSLGQNLYTGYRHYCDTLFILTLENSDSIWTPTILGRVLNSMFSIFKGSVGLRPSSGIPVGIKLLRSSRVASKQLLIGLLATQLSKLLANSCFLMAAEITSPVVSWAWALGPQPSKARQTRKAITATAFAIFHRSMNLSAFGYLWIWDTVGGWQVTEVVSQAYARA